MARDTEGLLARRMGEIVDGEYQKYSVAGGAYIREHFWGVDPRLLRMVAHLTDDQLWRMTLGGHDPDKVYAAYHAAVRRSGAPTVILARTIKGYGLGEAGEGKNITHQQKELNERELLAFRDRFQIPLSDEEVHGAPLYRPAEDSAEMEYMLGRRRALGGPMPIRRVRPSDLPRPAADLFDEFADGSDGREASTTVAFVRILTKLMRDPELGHHVVPIVPDEARTFGMEPMFREFGITRSRWTDRSWRKGSPKLDRSPHSSRLGRRTPRTARRCCRSSSSIRCLGCSASATWCGRRATRALEAS